MESLLDKEVFCEWFVILMSSQLYLSLFLRIIFGKKYSCIQGKLALFYSHWWPILAVHVTEILKAILQLQSPQRCYPPLFVLTKWKKKSILLKTVASKSTWKYAWTPIFTLKLTFCKIVFTQSQSSSKHFL